jgi:hypothetical protein
MGRHPLLVSALLASGKRGVASRTNDDGRRRIWRLHNSVDTLRSGSIDTRLNRALVKGSGSNSALGMKIARSIYSWTRHRWRMWDDSFLNDFRRSCVYIPFDFAFYRGVMGNLVEILWWGMRPQAFYCFLSTWLLLPSLPDFLLIRVVPINWCWGPGYLLFFSIMIIFPFYDGMKFLLMHMKSQIADTPQVSSEENAI